MPWSYLSFFFFISLALCLKLRVSEKLRYTFTISLQTYVDTISMKIIVFNNHFETN